MTTDTTTTAGGPVCRVCSRGFAPAEAALRDGDGMIHVQCAGRSAETGSSEDRPSD